MKLINPDRLSDYKTVNIYGKKHCNSLDDLRAFIRDNLPVSLETPDFSLVDMGYIEGGHGAKGRKIRLCDDDDLEKMYCEHKTKKILLWCYTSKKKDVRQKNKPCDTKRSRSSNYDSQLSKAEEVDVICESLKETHGNVYTPEQLRTWAHMLHVGTHDSCEEPPDKPFFRTTQRKRPRRDDLVSTPESKKMAVSHSPGRRVNLRSELIDQLKKCSDLAESGAISNDIFRDLQGTILSDIKHL